MRRHLGNLVTSGMVIREKHPVDQRASLLLIPAATIKLFSKFSGALTTISASHFR
jgi:hypothetical protein